MSAIVNVQTEEDVIRGLARLLKRRTRGGRKLRTQDGFILCDNCDTPADRAGSAAVQWYGCGGCIFGSASEIDPAEFIVA